MTDNPENRDRSNADSSESDAGVIGNLMNAFSSARESLVHLLQLMSMEAHRAGIALMWMAVAGIVAGICLVAAWLSLMAILAMLSVSLGLPPLAAVIAVMVFNLAAGILMIYIAIDKSGDLLFPATRRQVAGKAAVPPPAS